MGSNSELLPTSTGDALGVGSKDADCDVAARFGHALPKLPQSALVLLGGLRSLDALVQRCE